MTPDDLIVEVRDASLTRVAQLAADDLAGLVIADRANDVGSWSLKLPHTVLDPHTGDQVPHLAAQHLRKEGAGIIVTALTPSGPEVIISGPMAKAVFSGDSGNVAGEWEISGFSDAILLADALAYPSPGVADPTAQTAANDTRTAAAEDLLRQYVAYNIANGDILSPPVGWGQPERLVGFRERLYIGGTSQHRGARLTKSPRFQNLLELCQEVAAAGGLLFDIVQVGALLEFRVTAPADRSKLIRMDMANELLKSATYGYGAPGLTVPLVAGQGQGTDRMLVTASTPDSIADEARWGRRIERFFDQRNTDDPAELTQKADEALADGAASTKGLQVAPSESETMQYLRDWRKGDIVAVVVEGQEVAVRVSEVAVGVSGAALTTVATLGDAGAFDVDAAAQNRSTATASRLSAVERTAETTGPVPDQAFASDLGALVVPPTGAWTPATGGAVTMSNLPRPLVADVRATALVVTQALAYGLSMGIAVSGALTLGPVIDQETGAVRGDLGGTWAGTYQAQGTVQRRVTLPAGTSTFTLMGNLPKGDSGTGKLAAIMQPAVVVTPVRWA